MNYLSIENIEKSFGERILFKNLSFGINQGQKIGFIAKNGTGKSSLMKLLAGLESPDSGQIITRKGLRVGYLPQQPVFNEALTIEESVLQADNPILEVRKNYDLAVQKPDDADALQLAFEEMEKYDAWDFETRYKQILFKLQLQNLNQKINQLSGGQKKRLSLGLLLINKPDFLILDEPTNHLDLEMTEWLEKYLSSTEFTLFMVTHDRYFLDRICTEITELDLGNFYHYKGNYQYYLEKKEARLLNEKAHQEKNQNLFRRELEWMRRQPKARTSKSKKREQDFEELNEQVSGKRKDQSVQLEINVRRLGSKIVELHRVSKKYDERVLIKNFNHVFKKGEKAGIVGRNGSGKTTLLNIITKKIAPDTGKVVQGETVQFGYYTQQGIEIKKGQKVIEVIKDYGEAITLTKGKQLTAAQLLERFLFDRKQQYDYVEKLSGGELKRLYLCTVLIQNPNFLIMDEPTNDLDIVTLQVLEQFLMDFGGCVLIVSHDRYFMDRVTDHLFVFEEEGNIKDFPGNYSEYREWKIENSQKKSKDETQETRNRQKKRTPKKLSYNEQKELGKLEIEIEKLEEIKKELEIMFTQDALSGKEIDQKSIELQDVIQQIEDKSDRWFELSAKLEAN